MAQNESIVKLQLCVGCLSVRNAWENGKDSAILQFEVRLSLKVRLHFVLGNNELQRVALTRVETRVTAGNCILILWLCKAQFMERFTKFCSNALKED